MSGTMLWVDTDPTKNLAEKVTKAVEYYKKRRGVSPTIVRVHPDECPDAVPCNGITVIKDRKVLPYHLWIGVE